MKKPHMKAPASLILSVFLFFTAADLWSQCDPKPFIEGDPLLCPNGSAVLSTQNYSSYQWYRIPWGGGAAELITGAEGPELVVTWQDVLYSFFVEVSQDTCVDQSDTVLVDGLAFIPPYVIHEGDYTYDPQQGVFVVCRGDTMFLTFSYEVNITWFRDGQPIEGENGQVLAVTQAGAYTVQGAPLPCPDHIEPLGLVLEVVLEDCQNALDPVSPATPWRLTPLPGTDRILVERHAPAGPGQWRMYDLAGRMTWSGAGHGAEQELIPVGAPGNGMYILQWIGEDGRHQSGKITINQ